MSHETFDFMPYILILIKKRWVLVINFVLSVCVGLAVAMFVFKVEYKSSITLLPPASENGLSGILSGINLPSTLQTEIAPEQIAAIFESDVLSRQMIDKFRLYEHYKVQKEKDRFRIANKMLRKALLLGGNEKGAMGFSKTLSYTLSAYHTSADTALEMANYAFGIIDSAIRSISCGRAHNNRVFIEEQYTHNQLKLDTLQSAFKSYQIDNKAYSVQDQVKSTVKAYTDLKVNIMALELKISELNNEFSIPTPEVNSLIKMKDAYSRQLTALENNKQPGVMPSLKLSAEMFPEYSNLYREVETQTQILLYMRKELEQAKFKEAKDVSPLFVVDPAVKAEYKSRPKRATIVLMIVIPYFIIVMLLVILQEAYVRIWRDTKVVREMKTALGLK